MKLTAENNAIANAFEDARANDPNAALALNSLQGDPTVSLDVVTGVVEKLSDPGRSIALRSIANSALFQAISSTADYNTYISNPRHDELQAQRLKQRGEKQAQIYQYFSAEAATHAESTYDQAMSFDDMFEFVLKAEPKAPDTAEDNYDTKFLKKLGLTKAQAIEADIEEHEKDLARFTTKVENMRNSRLSIQAEVENAEIGEPDILAIAAYKMLQKVEIKLSDEPVRLWKIRNKVPGVMAKMVLLTDDLPIVSKAIKALRDAYKGDDRVRFDQ